MRGQTPAPSNFKGETMADDINYLIPQPKKIVIGTKQIKEYELYPLSIKDQRQITDLIIEIIKMLVLNAGDNNLALIGRLAEAITTKVPEILSVSLGIDKAEAEEATNDQVIYIVNIILDDNYKDIQKKISSIAEKVMSIFLSGKSSQESVNTMDTPLNKEAGSQESK